MIETERLLLRPVAVADLAEVVAMLSDPGTSRFLGGVSDPEGIWNKHLRNIGHWTAFGYGIFTVRRVLDGAYVGQIGLGHFCRGLGTDFDPFPEAGWVLDGRMHGQGYALEAARAVHRWFTAEQGAGRRVCLIHPDNAASLRVAERMGYRPYDTAEYRNAPAVKLELLPETVAP
ncbi:GNAT family N-acetyltransferase [Paenirhodobacter sp.]|uniref:GNAT family N-acetyltransferase n=1 Tax=Paenirhodobacter sp. TaxID=1965326 RepID=UPI003B425A2B